MLYGHLNIISSAKETPKAKEIHSANIGTAKQILALKIGHPICCLEKNSTPRINIRPTIIQEYPINFSIILLLLLYQ